LPALKKTFQKFNHMAKEHASPINTRSDREQNRNMERYYRFQSKIYDLTRWSFLFGRRRIIRELPLDTDEALSILEVGCGTGFNLQQLACRFPKARIKGMDVSPDMIRIAHRQLRNLGERIELVEAPYGPGAVPAHYFDLILFSYSLTMINPQWGQLIRQAFRDLKPGGYIAVVDFHNSRFSWFKRHMSNHHVRMDSHLLPLLQELFHTEKSAVHPAYGGVWEYLTFLGKKG